MIPIIKGSGKPLYEQIYDFYRDAILHDRLKEHDRLPSYRVLARELAVGNNTVLRAYEQLTLEGYVKNENRRGLFVMAVDSSEWQLNSKKIRSSPVKKPQGAKIEVNTSAYLVDETNFPIKQWRKCSNWALDHISFQYQEHETHDPLKDQLVKYLFNYRGVRTSTDRLLIGSGASALVFWLGFILRKSCSRIIVEEPCYPRARSIFKEFGYNVKPVRVGRDGIDLQKLLREKAHLVYLTPSHQYPTGTAIPVGNRLQILKWAKANHAWIVEDDFDCEFRYKTRLMPSLQGLDQSDRVIYVGTFSSALMPSLRVAYMVLPENFPVPYQAFTYLTNTVPYFTRKTLAHFMERGYWERHLKRMRNVYKKKYETCIDALKRLPKGHIEFNNTPSGLNILLRINTRMSESELVTRARHYGIVITAVSEFYLERKNQPAKPELLLEFGSMPQNEIEKIVLRLHKAWFGKSSKTI